MNIEPWMHSHKEQKQRLIPLDYKGFVIYRNIMPFIPTRRLLPEKDAGTFRGWELHHKQGPNDTSPLFLSHSVAAREGEGHLKVMTLSPCVTLRGCPNGENKHTLLCIIIV